MPRPAARHGHTWRPGNLAAAWGTREGEASPGSSADGDDCARSRFGKGMQRAAPMVTTPLTWRWLARTVGWHEVSQADARRELLALNRGGA